MPQVGKGFVQYSKIKTTLILAAGTIAEMMRDPKSLVQLLNANLVRCIA
ncbi:hypothetical protein [Halomonas sp. E19]